MAAPQARQWGVTPPISLSLPTDAELATNDALIAELKRQNNFEGTEETEKRYTASNKDPKVFANHLLIGKLPSS